MTRAPAAGPLDLAPMRPREVLARRLDAQGIGAGRATPVEVVRRLAAVQAQDHAGGLWAVGVRTGGADRAEVERAIADGRIVRTWPMRGTLHFVCAEDVRWLLGLLGGRVIAAGAGRRRQLGIGEEDERTARRVVVRALEEAGSLTRTALFAALADAGCSPAGQRGIHLLQRLALEQVICFGPHLGKQPAVVLLDAMGAGRRRTLARGGPCPPLPPLLRRPRPGGPARPRLVDGPDGRRRAGGHRVGRRPAGPHRDRGAGGLVDGAAAERPVPALAPPALLPPYEEYLLGYRDRDLMLDRERQGAVNPSANGIFSRIVVVAGRVAGTWRRSSSPDGVTVTVEPFHQLGATARDALGRRARAYGRFEGAPATIAFTTPRDPPRPA